MLFNVLAPPAPTPVESVPVVPEPVDGTMCRFDYDPSLAALDCTPTAHRTDPRLIISRSSPYRGMRVHGLYDGRNPIVSFLYHKWNGETLEQQERVIILTAKTFGIHEKDHFHQQPGVFWGGPDIGRYDPRTGTLTLDAEARPYDPKYFSDECIDRRHVDRDIKPVVANPWADPALKALLCPPNPHNFAPSSDQDIEQRANAALGYIKQLLANAAISA